MKSCNKHTERKVFSKGLCVECYKKEHSKPLKRTPLKKKPFVINKVAPKRKVQNKAYLALRKDFLIEHPTCEIRGLKCQVKATEIHHTRGRENKMLLNKKWWKAVCHNCHREVTDNSKKAIEDGHSHSKHKL